MQPEGSNWVVLNEITRRKLWELLGTACIFLFAPLIVIALILLYIYRRSVEIVLKIQLRSKFAGFLKGTDYVWAVEDAVSLSVVNVLMILEKRRNSNAIFMEDFKNLINDRIVSKTAGTKLEKMFYLRSQKFGYYFWEKSGEIDLKDRIRWLECANAHCDGSCEDLFGENFRRILENMCNKPLPNDHRAAWEILVGRRCTKSRSHVKEGRLFPEECFNTDTQKIPILVRIHHSLSDGPALLGLLLKTVVDEDETSIIKSVISSGETGERFKEMPILRTKRNFQNETDIMRFCELKQQAKISIDHTWLSLKDIMKRMYDRIKEVMRLMMILLSSPNIFARYILRSSDEKYASLFNPFNI